jgi:AcrR family transcriptional regulator
MDMPPSVKVSKEAIVRAATDLVRREGADALCARNVAAALSCSTQPIFSNFRTMEELRFSVVEEANRLAAKRIQEETESGEFPAYKAGGMGYIRFAKEEPELFRLLYMRDRSAETIPETDESTEQMVAIIRENTGLDDESARLFHLEMWATVHGIATMLVTGFFDIDRQLISRMLTDCYFGRRHQYERRVDR